MIVQINACHDVRVIPTADEEVRILTYKVLLPYLPGIALLHGLGRVRDRTIELASDWSGWPSDTPCRAQTAVIVTRPNSPRSTYLRTR